MYIVLDLGATNLKGGVIRGGEILVRTSVDTSRVNNLAALLSKIDLLISDLITKLTEHNLVNDGSHIENEGGLGDYFEGLGLGVPGFISENGHYVMQMVNLGIPGVELKPLLEKRYQLPVFIENDANAAVWGEYKLGWGRRTEVNGVDGSEQVKSLLMLTLGTGVGGGVVVEGKIQRGKYGLSGELGHIQVRPDSERICSCGKFGCLETESSASAIAYYWEKNYSHIFPGASAKEVLEMKASGQKEAAQIVDTASKYLGLALANMLHVIEFQRIILGGGLAAAGNEILHPVHTYIQEHLYDCRGFPVSERVVLTQLGNDAPLYGLYDLIISSNA